MRCVWYCILLHIVLEPSSERWVLGTVTSLVDTSIIIWAIHRGKKETIKTIHQTKPP